MLNRPSTVRQRSIDKMDQASFITQLDDVPTHEEIIAVVKSLPNAKSPGDDGITEKLFKCSGEAVHQRLVDHIQIIWREETVPQQPKNVTIVTIYEKKGRRRRVAAVTA